MLIQSPPLIVCLFVWPSARQPISTNTQGTSDLLHLPVNTASKQEVTYEHDSVASAGTERACVAKRAVVAMITMATQQKDCLLPLSVLLYSCLASVYQLSLPRVTSSDVLMLMVSAPPRDTITDLLWGHLNLHQEAKYHSSSLRKTFLKSDTAVIFILSTNEPHTQAAIILVRRRKTKTTSLI